MNISHPFRVKGVPSELATILGLHLAEPGDLGMICPVWILFHNAQFGKGNLINHHMGASQEP